ncbi:carbohydrate ABC transporter permease [Amnibacterium sp. CER49]|uniref:carbohydrate ABC transporter permease n=1 Tax=Amnibacterium sp. CER49 TaxID=3039161 RepID=UPI002449C7BE|nr:carbohydrate ABC transporter permease [Amnibacterium sp. CER49]MDH2442593.1 carbohydrate ABC transporter permease [Amnibacterium sp. CER49]
MTVSVSDALVPEAVARSPRRRTVARHRRPSTVLTVMVWVSLAYFLLPIVWLVITSTKSNADIFNSFGLWFSRFSLFDNLQQTFTQDHGVFGQWLLNTLMYSVGSAVGAAIFATAAGFALAKYRFVGRRLIFSVILGAIMVPGTALAIPTYLLFSALGLTDTPLAIVLPSLISPFGVYLMRVYAAEAVDDGLLEAARIDGAGEFRILYSIALRLLAPGIVTVLLFTLVDTWNNYFLPLIMLNNPALFPVTVGLTQWQSRASGGGGAQVMFSSVITGSLVSVLPLIVAFLFLQRYWQSGLGTGGVKG